MLVCWLKPGRLESAHLNAVKPVCLCSYHLSTLFAYHYEQSVKNVRWGMHILQPFHISIFLNQIWHFRLISTTDSRARAMMEAHEYAQCRAQHWDCCRFVVWPSVALWVRHTTRRRTGRREAIQTNKPSSRKLRASEAAKTSWHGVFSIVDTFITVICTRTRVCTDLDEATEEPVTEASGCRKCGQSSANVSPNVS